MSLFTFLLDIGVSWPRIFDRYPLREAFLRYLVGATRRRSEHVRGHLQGGKAKEGIIPARKCLESWDLFTAKKMSRSDGGTSICVFMLSGRVCIAMVVYL